MSASHDELAAIDPALLSRVSAGVLLTAGAGIADQLNGLLDTIRSISTFQQRSGFNAQDTMLLMLLLQSQRRPIVAPVAPWAPPGYYY